MSNTLLASIIVVASLSACGDSQLVPGSDAGALDVQGADASAVDMQPADAIAVDGQPADSSPSPDGPGVAADGTSDEGPAPDGADDDGGAGTDGAQTVDQSAARDAAGVDAMPMDVTSLDSLIADAPVTSTAPPHLLATGFPTTSCQIAGPTGLKCWGKLTHLGVAADSAVAADVPAVSSLALVSISAGYSALCAISSTGGLHCLGTGPVGHSTPNSEGYYDVFGLQSGVIDVRLGREHGCSLSDDGTVHCWGSNTYGQLGQPTSIMTGSIIPQVAASGAARVGVGRYHSCLLTSQRTVQCWGRNSSGQLGDTTKTNADSPVDVPGLGDVVEIGLGEDHTCALLESGSVRCWGDNSYGQLGDGTTTSSDAPVAVQNITDAIGLSSGTHHVCVIRQSGAAVSCWGRNTYGQVGSPDTGEDPVRPVAVAGLSGVVEVAAGNYHTCARTASATRCWGNNSVGQLGYGAPGAFVTSLAEIDLQSGTPAAMCSGANFSCGLFGGRVRCWGRNDSGQLATGDYVDSTAPVEVALPADASAIACGGRFACAASASKVHCWGDNSQGPLGADPAMLAKSSSPVEVAGAPASITSLSAGYHHVCAVASGEVWCWGGNARRQLGRNTGGTYDITPTTVPAISSATSLYAGSEHNCAVVQGGVQCWGANNGAQCGVASSTSVGVTLVAGVQSEISAVAAGTGHSCALTSGGAVKCWGTTATGHTGNFDPVPKDVPDLSSGAKMIASASSTMCAITPTDTIVCWGFNANGEAAQGAREPTYIYTPAEVVGLDITPSVLGVEGMGARFFAWDAAGAMRAWGVNTYGEIGNGFSIVVPTPQTVVGL